MKKFRKYIKKLYNLIIKYIYTNRLFLTYLILAITGTIILRNVTINSSFGNLTLLKS